MLANTQQLSQFEDAMRTHCSEAAEIVGKFSAQWLTKNFDEGGGKMQSKHTIPLY